MKERKVHYMPNRHKAYVQCGAVVTNRTVMAWNVDSTTCRVCMFSYLAEQAPWAREFMDKLRGADVAAKRSSGSFEGMEARGMAAGPTAFDRVNPDGMPPALVLALGYGGSVCPGCTACPHQPEVEARHVLQRNPIRFEGSVGAGAHGAPMGPSAHAHSPIERLGRSLASLLSNDAIPQKTVCEFLSKTEPPLTAVQVVMDYSGAAAGAVGVKPSQVAEQAGDAGQVSAEPNRDF